MVSPNTKRPKGSGYFQSASMPETSSCQAEVLVTNTTHHAGEYHNLGYDEIYRMFNTGDFPPEDENMEVYQNI
jgi:hypothetical protein